MRRKSFLVVDLGEKEGGELLKVTLLRRKVGNVKLLDQLNYRNYQKNQYHLFWGGRISNHDSVFIAIPSKGYWYAVVDSSEPFTPKLEAKLEFVNKKVD